VHRLALFVRIRAKRLNDSPQRRLRTAQQRRAPGSLSHPCPTASRNDRTLPPCTQTIPPNHGPAAAAAGVRHPNHVVPLGARHDVLARKSWVGPLHAQWDIALMQSQHRRAERLPRGSRQGVAVRPHAYPPTLPVSAITIGSDATNPDAAIPALGPATILLRNLATSAACTVGSTHRATAGARPTRPKTVTSPDATDDHRHQLRPWTIRPQPPCLGRHRLVPAKRPTQRPHPRNLVLANHSPKRCPTRARRSEVL
jgi:hypothetical protein